MRLFVVAAALALATLPARADVPSQPVPSQPVLSPADQPAAPADQPAPPAAQPPVEPPEQATVEPAVLPALPLPAAQPDDDRVESYRLHTLGADVLAAGILVTAISLDQEEVAIFAVPTYLLIAPLMHWSKDRPGHALASISMRVGWPLLGVLIGDSFPKDCGPAVCLGGSGPGIIYGFFGGAVAAAALDTIFLAKGDPSPAQTQTAWTPVAGPIAGGFALGVNGRF